jgi:hypothetical protein
LAALPVSTPTSPAISVDDLPIDFPKDGFSSLDLTPKLFFSTLNSTDKSSGQNAVLPSVDFGINAAWTQHWNPEFKTHLSFGFSEYFFYPTVSGTTTLANSSLSSLEVEAGFEKNYGDFTLAPQLAFKQEIFSVGTSTTQISFDRLLTPVAQVGGDYKLLETSKLAFGVSAELGLLFGASNSLICSQLGTLYGGKLWFEKKSNNFKNTLRGSLGWEGQSQNTSVSQQSVNSITLDLGFSFPFIKREEDP